MKSRIFPSLSLLQLLATRLKPLSPLLRNIRLVCVQHLLLETGSLLESLIELGLPPHQIFILGKPYSTNPSTERMMERLGVAAISSREKMQLGHFGRDFAADVGRLWSRALQPDGVQGDNRYVILDDGGFGFKGAPRGTFGLGQLKGIEQTTSGLGFYEASSKVPMVSVATSAVKRFCEPIIVHHAMLRKLRRRIRILAPKLGYGIVGIGNIGKVIASELRDKGFPVTVYDVEMPTLAEFSQLVPGTRIARNLPELFSESDIIFGCTGHDIFSRDTGFESFGSGNKTLVSCSSGDIEFRTLLRSGKMQTNFVDPYAPLTCTFGKLCLTVLEGGFPITFDRNPVSAPLADMQLTRALLFGAIFQAASLDPAAAGLIKLDAAFQQWVVDRWLELRPARNADYSPGLINAFKDRNWVEQESGGQTTNTSFSTLFCASASGRK